MSRLVIACVLFASWCHAAASSEPMTTTKATQFAAKVKYLKVDDGKQIVVVETEVTGIKGTPLKTTLGGKNGLTLKLEIQDVPGGKPSQPARYFARFRLVERKGDKEMVLSQPALMATVGQPAQILIGNENDRIDVDLTVWEIVSAANESKPTAHIPAKSGQPPAPAVSSLESPPIKMATPRLIIQEEEEDKLGVQPPP